jgi:hypothetical protein
MTSKFFGRLGTRAMFQKNVDEAVKLGAELKEDKEAKTLEVTWQGETLIKAIAKDANVWIVTYNKEFYAH